MPRLTRKNIKVFAGSATNNGVFGSLQANNPTTTSDVEQLQSLSAWSEGWNAATETSEELPPLEEIQGVEYVTTYQQAYLMQEGIPEWASSVTYYKGSVVKEVTSTGFKIYNSLTDNNTGNLLSDTSNWKLVMDSDDLYAFDNTVVHKTGAETITGTKTFASSPVIPSGSSSTDAVNKGQLDSVSSSVSALDGAVVKLTGDQTIAGNKTFTNAVNLANGTWNTLGDDSYFGDANVAGGFCIKGNNASSRIALFDRNSSYNNGFYLDENDNNGLKIINPTVGAIAWGSVTAMVGQNPSGYIKFNHGLIIQWGNSTATSSSGYVTLLTPFASTNYAVIINDVMADVPPSQQSNANLVGWGVIQSRSTTSFTAFLCNYENSSWWRWGEGRSFTWIAIGY